APISAGSELGSFSTGGDTRVPTDQPASPMRRSYLGQSAGHRQGASGAMSRRQKRATSPEAYVRLWKCLHSSRMGIAPCCQFRAGFGARGAGSAAILAVVFERFTDRARRTLVLAQEEARLLDHNFIGTEHLLLGLVREGEGVAAVVLQDLGVTLEAVRQEVIGLLSGRRAEDPVAPDAPPICPRCRKSLLDTASYKKLVVRDADAEGPMLAF